MRPSFIYNTAEAGMLSPLRWLLSCWVSAEVRPEFALQNIVTVQASPVCYVFERRSLCDVAVVENLCRKYYLPLPSGRLLGRGTTAVYAALALLQRRAWYDARIDRHPPAQLLQLIDALRADVTLDVRLVSVAVYWGRAPQKEGSWLRLSLSEKWALSGALRKLLQVIFNGRLTMLEVGEVVSLRSQLNDYETSAIQAARLTRIQRASFRRQRSVRIGPDMSHRRTVVLGVLQARSVRVAIAQEARTKSMSRSKAMRLAQSYTLEIAANYSHRFVIFFANLLQRVWTRLYDGIEFNHIQTLHDAARDHEIIFVPSHRSHMDYLLLSYAIYMQGYSVPHIAAGINLNIPIVGSLLRKAGAFFIRRSFSGNKLYTAVFLKYLSAIMSRGHSLEYFIEGGRSRTGRLLHPKTGMLYMTVRSYLRDTHKPIIFLPIYFGYERIAEERSYVAELLGKQKIKESFFSLLGSFRVLKEKYGRVHVNIGEPIMLDNLLIEHKPDWRMQPVCEETRSPWINDVVVDLAKRIMSNINSAAAVTPINLLAVTLLAAPRQAMSLASLSQQIDLYLALLRYAPYDRRVTVSGESGAEVIAYGENMKIVQRQTHVLGDVLRVSDEAAVLLTYYRNNVLHLFTLPSLVACAFIGNAIVTTVDIQRLVWRIYPFIGKELFLKWTEAELPKEVDLMLQLFGRLGILEAQDDGLAWRRPVSSSANAYQLSLLAQSSIQTIERYYLAISVLIKAGSGVLSARALSERCQLMAQRITMLYGFNSPEFSDRTMFDNFIRLLLNRSVIKADVNGNLVFDEVLDRVAIDAEFVLSQQIRHSILQVTHA
ncbi:MAG: glycerol-3-phosphate 1-O-acyltransferase PlsB [Gammaproteobacteria bacterium]|nr:glycerol-3-phosphate 1-O-acyltransferase PlsB [Gammaproteobacteria bacterium]